MTWSVLLWSNPTAARQPIPKGLECQHGGTRVW